MSYRLPRARCCAVAIAAFALFGCSAHPLPGDFSRKSTFDIVEKIRCEGAEALRGIPRGHPFLQETYVGYDFDFDITEVNDTGTIMDPGQLFFKRERPSGSLTLDLKGHAERTRAAQRTFRIVESLEQLKTADCSPTATRPNLLYPITGSIGMNEIIRTYVGLERLTTLAEVVAVGEGTAPPHTSLDPPGPKGSTSVVFSDVLIFTTKLGGSVKPVLELNVIGVGGLKLKTAQIFGQATREDFHRLTVVLARDPLDPDEPPDETNETVRYSHAHKRRWAKAADRARKTKPKRERFKKALNDYLKLDPGYNLPNSVTYSPSKTRIIRTLETMEKKDLDAKTRVVVELERRRSSEEDDKFILRLLEILKP